MKVLAITQARIGSTRLPAKVLKKIGVHTLLDIHLMRLKQCKTIDDVLVATTEEDESDLICEIAERQGVLWYKGSMDDVLDRFYQAARPQNPDWVVRVTSDCPLLDPEVIDAVVNMTLEGGFDYGSNTLIQDFPDGQDIELCKMKVLEYTWKNATKLSDREHVTPFIQANSDQRGGNLFTAKDYKAPANYNHVRMTVDEPADFEMMEWLIGEMGLSKTWKEYTDYMLSHPEKLVNADIIRNEGYLKSLQKDEEKKAGA